MKHIHTDTNMHMHTYPVQKTCSSKSSWHVIWPASIHTGMNTCTYTISQHPLLHCADLWCFKCPGTQSVQSVNKKAWINARLLPVDVIFSHPRSKVLLEHCHSPQMQDKWLERTRQTLMKLPHEILLFWFYEEKRVTEFFFLCCFLTLCLWHISVF